MINNSSNSTLCKRNSYLGVDRPINKSSSRWGRRDFFSMQQFAPVAFFFSKTHALEIKRTSLQLAPQANKESGIKLLSTINFMKYITESFETGKNYFYHIFDTMLDSFGQENPSLLFKQRCRRYSRRKNQRSCFETSCNSFSCFVL